MLPAIILLLNDFKKKDLFNIISNTRAQNKSNGFLDFRPARVATKNNHVWNKLVPWSQLSFQEDSLSSKNIV